MTSPHTLQVTVLDYGIGNLLNVARALEHSGATVRVAAKASEVVELPDRMVLPGVGAFGDAMHEMRLRGFDDLVKRFAATERPFLGILMKNTPIVRTGFSTRTGCTYAMI